MTNQRHISKPPNRLLWLLFSLFMLKSALAADLVFDPAAPTVQVGQQLTLSVSGISGDITWTPSKGQIQGTGNRVTYLAPTEAGLDSVMVLDSAGNLGAIKITVTPKQLISLENAKWEVITDRNHVKTLLLSDDGKTLWVGTEGGLEQRDAKTGMLVRVLTNLDGLPDNSIKALESDGHDGLWIATHRGLAHYSSRSEWIIYTTKNSGLPSDLIEALESDGRGGLWIATRRDGLAYRSISGEWKVYTKDNSGLPYHSIKALESDGSGGLWIGTENTTRKAHYLVYRSVSGEWKVYTKDNSGLPSNSIEVLESDGSGGLWIGTFRGLAYRSASGEWALYNHYNSGLPSNLVYALENDGNGGLWIGTSRGLAYYHTLSGEWALYNRYNSGLPSNWVSALLHNGNGGLWIGIFPVWNKKLGGGLAYRSYRSKWTVYTTNHSGLPSNRVRTLESEGSSGHWIGTFGGGLAYHSLSGEKTLYTKHNSKLPSNLVSALESDGSNGLWIGTNEDGLAYRSVNGKWSVYTKDNSDLPNNWINALESDGSGGVWIGTYRGGLAYRNVNGDWSVFTTDNSGLPDNMVRTLESDGSGGLWIGTEYGGLAYRSVNGEWTIYNRYNSKLPSNRVFALESDGSGGLWIGTEYGGLAYRSSRSKKTEWTIYNRYNSDLPSNRVFALKSDGRGGLWIGSKEGLAYRSYRSKWTVYTTDNSGLPSNGVGTLLGDGSSGLWIGTGYSGLAHLTFSQKNSLCTDLNDVECRKVQTRAAIYPREQGSGYKQDVSIQTHLRRQGAGYKQNVPIQFMPAFSEEITLEPETMPEIVTAGQKLPLVVCTGISESHIKRVWALVMTPEFAKQRHEKGFSLIPSPMVNLTQKADDASCWQGSFSGFKYQGDYVVTFMAEDNEGFISAKPVVLTQPKGPEVGPFLEGYPPILSQTIYYDGDIVRVSLPVLPADQKQYVALYYPDKTLYFLTGLNSLDIFDGSSVPVWQESGDVAIEMLVTDFPKGEYIVYLLRIPALIDLLNYPEEWRIGFSTFRVE